jgi:hypothetical protein
VTEPRKRTGSKAPRGPAASATKARPARKAKAEDLGDRLAAEFEAEGPRRRALVEHARESLRTSEQAAVVALLAPGGRQNAALRKLWAHELGGVNDATIAGARSVVQLLARAIESNERDTIAAVAAALPGLLGVAEKYQRVRAIFGAVEAWLAALPDALERHPWARERLPLSTLAELAQAGMPVSEDVARTFVAEVLGAPKSGYGAWGAPKATERLMRLCGAEGGASEKRLRDLIREARCAKNLAAKNG